MGTFQYDSLYTCPAPGSSGGEEHRQSGGLPRWRRTCAVIRLHGRNPASGRIRHRGGVSRTVCAMPAPEAMTITSDNARRHRTTECYPVNNRDGFDFHAGISREA